MPLYPAVFLFLHWRAFLVHTAAASPATGLWRAWRSDVRAYSRACMCVWRSASSSGGAAPSPNGTRQWRPDAPCPRDVSGDRASEIDAYSSEESFQSDALASAGLGQSLNLAALPDGMLERIYGFCPHSVVPHLSVCRSA